MEGPLVENNGSGPSYSCHAEGTPIIERKVLKLSPREGRVIIVIVRTGLSNVRSECVSGSGHRACVRIERWLRRSVLNVKLHCLQTPAITAFVYHNKKTL